MTQNLLDPKILLQAIDKQPLILPADTPVLAAITAMSENLATYTLIVEQQKLIGIFTERDVVKITANAMCLEQTSISEMMTQELITITLTTDHDIFSVLAILRISGIRHLPVLDDVGHVIGVITRESLRQVLKPTDLLQTRRVSEIMTTEVITATQTCSVFEVAQQMAIHRKSCIVICLPDGDRMKKPVGVITERDIVKFTSHGLNLLQTPASLVMSCPLLLIRHNASLWEANYLMQQNGIRRLVVVQDENLAGIITQASLFQALDPIDMYATVKLLQQTITTRTQELTQANKRMQQEAEQRQHVEQALQIAKNNLEVQVKTRTLELFQANAFLQAEIRDRIAAETEVRRLNAELEARVVERTSQLQASNQQLSQAISHIQATQKELIQVEKMAALGQLIAGVAHEINTPLGAICASTSNIANALEKSLLQLSRLKQLPDEELDLFFTLIATAQVWQPNFSSTEQRLLKRLFTQELEEHGIGNTGTGTVLSSMGITDIVPFLQILKSENKTFILEAAYNVFIQKNNLENVKLAAERASKIVVALKSYVRQDNGQMSQALVTEGIDMALTIYQNKLKRGINVTKKYEPTPEILCYPEELNQVWTNLICNAAQAMQYQGELEICVRQDNQDILIEIIDSGIGIKPENKDKVFTPFFTTKPLGEGSGLGLDIVCKIIHKHQGKIAVESEPGRTNFQVWLPIK